MSATGRSTSLAARTDAAAVAPVAPDRSAWAAVWACYFTAKLWLSMAGVLNVVVWQNAVLLAFALWPIPPAMRARGVATTARATLAILAGVVLLWSDSWLPPFATVIARLADPAMRPAPASIAPFGGLVPSSVALGHLVAIGAAVAAAISLVGRPRAAIAMAATAVVTTALVQPRPGPAGIAERIERFYAAEGARSIAFDTSRPAPPPADILFVHVSSMSWDDLGFVGLDDHPFLTSFDAWFSRFNSVSAAGDVSALRLLRSACGHARHTELYEDAPDACSLPERLRAAGYETYTVLNHSREHGGMGRKLVRLASADAPMALEGLPVAAIASDGTPIFDDYATLERWWETRTASSAERAFAYYDTISLHEGARPAGRKPKHDPDGPKGYYEAADRLFDELARFFRQVEAWGRNMMIVLVAEHGRGLRDAAVHKPRLGGVPLPSLVHVPLGIKLIGRDWEPGPPRMVPGETSYQAIAHVVAEVLRDSPFATGHERLDAILDAAPHTPFLAENAAYGRIAPHDGRYYLEDKRGRWTLLAER